MKIKNKIITKLINLTECEWKLFEYMIRRQDKEGKVFGVHNLFLVVDCIIRLKAL